MVMNKRLSPNQLAEVKNSFAGLKQVADYAPLKNEFKISAIEPIAAELDSLLIEEAQTIAQLNALRDRIAETGTSFVQKMKGAAQQVTAQFGDDSPEIQSLGRKRASERGTRRPRSDGKQPGG